MYILLNFESYIKKRLLHYMISGIYGQRLCDQYSWTMII